MPRKHSEAIEPLAAKKKKQQLTIVALLLVGLLIAIVTQPSGESQETNEATAELVSLKPIDSKPRKDPVAPREEITSTRELSRLEIDRIVQTRLFVMPEPKPELEQQIAVEETAPPEVKVQAIYGDGKLTDHSKSTGHRALIGRAIIGPGEVLPDGRQIVRVTPDGVELAE